MFSQVRRRASQAIIGNRSRVDHNHHYYDNNKHYYCDRYSDIGRIWAASSTHIVTIYIYLYLLILCIFSLKLTPHYTVVTTVFGASMDGGIAPVDVGDEAAAARSAGPWSLPSRPSLFNIIRFPNEECFDSSNQSGTCYTPFECKLIGGQPSSPCAAGFGSCCIVSRTCHVTTREKVVYFKNPNYPSADSEERFCDLTMEIDDPNVCQLRIDFLDFQLDQPTNGACKDDYLEISASGMSPQTVPRLCGLNRNQHLYITMPQEFGERSASIVFYTDAVGDHRWQLKITQIDCQLRRMRTQLSTQHLTNKMAGSPLLSSKFSNNGPYHKYSTTFASGFNTITQTASAMAYEMLRPQFTPRAPNGCLQYFTAPSGIIESFNFGQYLNQMDYSICIQRQSETCRIVFTSSDYDWSINGVGVSSATSGVGDNDCARDYLMIPGASRNGDGFTYDRYCGGRLNYYRGQTMSAPLVIKTNGPIVLRFHSDSSYESVNSGGFRLQYEQSNQDCMYHSAEEAGSLASGQLIVSTFGDSHPLPMAASHVSHNEISGPNTPTLDKLTLLYSSPLLSSLNESSVDSSIGSSSSPSPIMSMNNQPHNGLIVTNQTNKDELIEPTSGFNGIEGDQSKDQHAMQTELDLSGGGSNHDDGFVVSPNNDDEQLFSRPNYNQAPGEGEGLLLWRNSNGGGGGQTNVKYSNEEQNSKAENMLLLSSSSNTNTMNKNREESRERADATQQQHLVV